MGLSARILASIVTVILALASLSPADAAVDRRVALVIGNSAYKNVTKLPNPANDADAIAALLRQAGFEVVEHRNDLGIVAMRRAVRDFADKTRDADVAVVF